MAPHEDSEGSALADVSNLSSQQDSQSIVDLTTDVTTSQSLLKSPIAVSRQPALQVHQWNTKLLQLSLMTRQTVYSSDSVFQ